MSLVETELSPIDHVEPFRNEKCREVTHYFSEETVSPLLKNIYIYIPSYKKRCSRFKIKVVMQLLEAALFSTEM